MDAGTVIAPLEAQSVRLSGARLKFPAEFQRFFKEKGITEVFTTTRDLKSMRIYPMPVWQENEKTLEAMAQSNPAYYKQMSLIVRSFGSRGEVDSQGRFSLPERLRKHLGMEDVTVWLVYSNEAVDVIRDDVYQEQLAVAAANLAAANEAASMLGFK